MYLDSYDIWKYPTRWNNNKLCRLFIGNLYWHNSYQVYGLRWPFRHRILVNHFTVILEKKNIYNGHPSLFIFIKCLKSMQIETFINIQSCRIEYTLKRKDKFVQQRSKRTKVVWLQDWLMWNNVPYLFKIINENF